MIGAWVDNVNSSQSSWSQVNWLIGFRFINESKLYSSWSQVNWLIGAWLINESKLYSLWYQISWLIGSWIDLKVKSMVGAGFGLRKSRLYFVRNLCQFKSDETRITIFYKSVIESVLSFCITCWGGNRLKGDRMKVDKKIKISGKFTNHVLHLNELCHKKTIVKIISISKDVNHPLYRFLNKCKSNRIDGYSHIMIKTERYLRSFLPSAMRFLNDKNYNV